MYVGESRRKDSPPNNKTINHIPYKINDHFNCVHEKGVSPQARTSNEFIVYAGVNKFSKKSIDDLKISVVRR
jgi:hypothetical protein